MAVGDGLVRLRANQIGKQTVFGTAVATTRRVPWRGIVGYDPNLTDQDVDTGSIDPILPPISGAPNIDWNPTGPLYYNDLPYRLAAGLKGGVTPTGGGTAKTWTYTLLSLTADPFDYFTVESGDDQSATDGIRAFGGVGDTLEETMPDDLGVWTFSDSWIFGGATLATDRTAGLSVDPAPISVMGDESLITMDTTPGAIGVTQLSDVFHAATIRVSNNLDKKRFANGSNSRKQYAGWGRGARQIELILTFGKSAAVNAERATLDDDTRAPRYFKIATVSPTLAQAANPYSYTRQGAFRLYSATDGELGGNTTVTLTYRATYDSGLGYAYKAVVVNTLAAL